MPSSLSYWPILVLPVGGFLADEQARRLTYRKSPIPTQPEPLRIHYARMVRQRGVPTKQIAGSDDLFY
ncbi:MAG: hypothetical protein P8N76_26380 [Pirellulaceae bacterium]|nr:hypothetical protein [Pirellulaceae bacterium]